VAQRTSHVSFFVLTTLRRALEESAALHDRSLSAEIRTAISELGVCGMVLGGVPIEDQLVRRLTTVLGRPVADKLDRALLFRAQVVALTRDEKVAILTALEKAPPELERLRESLMADAGWHLSDRL